MRLEKHLNESPVNASFEEILTILWDKCQQILKHYTKNRQWQTDDLLWSGRKNNQDYFIKDVRKDRKPVDIEDEVHTEFDNAFNRKFGWKARSNALFVTGDWTQSINYGTAFMIFPMGHYRFVYSPSIYDAYRATISLDSFDVWKEKNDDGTKEEWMNGYDDVVRSYTNKDIHKAIISNNEIMLNAKKYMAIDKQYQFKLLEWFKTYGMMKPTDERLKEFKEAQDNQQATYRR